MKREKYDSSLIKRHSPSSYDPTYPHPCEQCQWSTVCPRLGLSCLALSVYENGRNWSGQAREPVKRRAAA